jgi:hypothetical protein
MTSTTSITAPTLESVTELTRLAGRKAFWHVHPRYTSGSPAMVSMGEAIKAAVDEYKFREINLSGVFGDELKARAETEGLEHIAYARWEAKGKVWRLDLLTGQVAVEPDELGWEERDRLIDLRGQKKGADFWKEPFRFENELLQLEARAKLHRQRIEA